MGSTAAMAVLSGLEFGLDLMQKQRQARAEDARAQTQAAAQSRQVELNRQIEERRRDERLRQTQARQRARFGALGVGGDGSAAAVLDGLAAVSTREGRDTNALFDERLRSIDESYASRPRRNLLAESSLDLLGQLSRNPKHPIRSLLKI